MPRDPWAKGCNACGVKNRFILQHLNELCGEARIKSVEIVVERHGIEEPVSHERPAARTGGGHDIRRAVADYIDRGHANAAGE